MALAPATQIGRYRIESLLGAGGMGEVYRARDTRLHREVALKILPESFASDPARRTRFEHEARALAALSHPNIVAIYDVGDNYIVSELVDGEPLRAILEHGPAQPRKVIEIGAQIADALSAAHVAGVVHRDIKPENIMLARSGRVKVLDFGLARQDLAPPPDRTATIIRATEPGMIVGTVAYMSPEQVRSQPLDHRSDIFSLGVLLYEMLTGKQPFGGASTVEAMNAILKEDPPDLPESIPPVLAHIVRRCMEKESRARFQSASDLAFALRTASGSAPRLNAVEPHATTMWQRRWVLGAFGVGVLAVCALAAWRAGERAAPSATEWQLTRLTYDSGLTTDPAISPDGKLVTYASDRAGESGLDIWVQHLAGGSAIRLTKEPGDESEPEFSADGGQIVYRSNREPAGIYVMPVLGGEPRLLVPGGYGPRFSPDGTRLAYWTGTPGSATGTTLRHVYVAPLRALATPALISGDLDAAHPVWSPDGRWILFAANDPGASSASAVADWYLAEAETGKSRPLRISEPFRARGIGPFTSHPAGWVGDHVFFAGPDVLKSASRIYRLGLSHAGDPGQLEPLTNGTGYEDRVAASASGAIVLSSANVTSDVWAQDADVNRGKISGDPVRVTQGPATEVRAGISGDGRLLAYLSNRAGNMDIWLRDLQAGIDTPVTATPGNESWPAISRDGSRILYVAGQSMFTAPLPRGVPVKLCEPCGTFSGLSHDGRYAVMRKGPTKRRELAKLEAMDLSTRASWMVARHPEWQLLSPRFSADTRWMVFHARNSETSRQIYAVPFRIGRETPQPEWIALTDGKALDRDPEWSPDGGLVYFLTDRDGYRCIAAQRVDASTKSPRGEMFYVRHFHDASRTMLTFDNTSLTAVTAAPRKLYFVLGERTGNIWLMQPAAVASSR